MQHVGAPSGLILRPMAKSIKTWPKCGRKRGNMAHIFGLSGQEGLSFWMFLFSVTDKDTMHQILHKS